MTKRSIPPLNKTNTKLIQVISIIRHGARTPYTDGMHCWQNYKSPNADTSQWDCNLNTILAPPTSPSIPPNSNNIMIMEKKYDALKAPLKNELNGSCQLGQLLLQGYIQEVRNGVILRKAYLDTPFHHMHLFHNTSVLSNETHLHTYYRADDMQRTLMSGQVLLTSLFNPNVQDGIINIPIHTTDKLVDILEPNTFTCPKLNEIRKQAYASKAFKLWNVSRETMDVRDILYNTLKTKSLTNEKGETREGLDLMIDCLMTTICTDKTLPDEINDFDGNETANTNFMRIANLSTWKWLYVYQYKKAAYSKLAMGPLWADIYERMAIATSNKPTSTSKERLVLYSAHDVTIMTLLASLDIDILHTFPISPYASLFNIEVHAILKDPEESEDVVDDDSQILNSTMDKELIQHGFRIIYNGQVITHLLPNCNEELCDINILFEHIQQFATRNRMKECAVINPPTIKTLTKESVRSYGQSPVISIVVAVISCFVGGFVSYYLLSKEKKRERVVADSSDLVMEEEDGGDYGSRGPGREVFKKVFDIESEII